MKNEQSMQCRLFWSRRVFSTLHCSFFIVRFSFFIFAFLGRTAAEAQSGAGAIAAGAFVGSVRRSGGGNRNGHRTRCLGMALVAAAPDAAIAGTRSCLGGIASHR